jgi:ATP-dependent Clp protease ATP-binding subunit ClpC
VYDRISDLGRLTLRGASQEACRLYHNYVRSEHLLLALLRDDTGPAFAVLRECGIDGARVVAVLDERTVPWVEEPGSLGVRYPLTPSAQNVLNSAFEETRLLGSAHVGPEHFLLGLIRETDCVAARLLAASGLTLDRAREAVGAIGCPPSAPFIVDASV